VLAGNPVVFINSADTPYAVVRVASDVFLDERVRRSWWRDDVADATVVWNLYPLG
jgi:hypothetical protein